MKPYKPLPIFYFRDSPQLCTTETRDYVATLLRSYRKQPRRYRITRGALGEHEIRLDSNAIPTAAIFTK